VEGKRYSVVLEGNEAVENCGELVLVLRPEEEEAVHLLAPATVENNQLMNIEAERLAEDELEEGIGEETRAYLHHHVLVTYLSDLENRRVSRLLEALHVGEFAREGCDLSSERLWG